MKRIQLWMVDGGPGGPVKAVAIEELTDTETERQLEDLLVASPEVLLDELSIVARQLPTDGGPVDLVGVDENGRLVVFELKRGVLTRDAVAQVIDYASDLEQMDPEALARLIEEHSGKRGVEPIEDFKDWFGREYPDVEEPFGAPRMVLVGLGADARATRMVNYLAKIGVEIELLTFHAFRSDGRVLIGRQSETVQRPGIGRVRAYSKETNLAALLQNAEEAGAKDLLLTVADHIEARLSCYRWPGKIAFSFSVQDFTDDGKPTLRNNMTLYVGKKRPRALLLTIADRAAEAVPEAIAALRQEAPSVVQSAFSGAAAEVRITRENWPELQAPLDRFLDQLGAAAKHRMAAGADV